MMLTRAAAFALALVVSTTVSGISSEPAVPDQLQPGFDADYRAKWAIVIGITAYPASSGLSELPGSAEGASALRDVLAGEFGYKGKEFGQDADHVKCLTEGEATQNQVRSRMFLDSKSRQLDNLNHAPSCHRECSRAALPS